MALLAAEALDLGDGDALHADRGQRLAHFVELEGLDDGGDEFHGFLRFCLMPGAVSEALADRQDHALVGEVAVVHVGVDVVQAEVEADELLGDAQLPVGVVVLALDVVVSDVGGQGDAVADVHCGTEVVVLAAVRLLVPEQVGEGVRVLERQELPRQADVAFERVRAVEALGVAARVVVLQEANVVADGADAALVAAVDVDLEAAADVGVTVGQPGHVRAPHAGVEAAFVRVVEAALQRGALVGLAVAAVGVVGDEADVGGEGAVLGMHAAGEGQGNEKGCKRGGDRGLGHDLLLGRGV